MQTYKGYALYFAMLVGSSIPSAVFANDQQGAFSAQFGWPIIPVHAALLPDGQVFSFGTRPNGEQQAKFEYGVWNFWGGWGAHQLLPNNPQSDIFCASASLLRNGNVLVAGGDTRNPINNGIKDTNILDWQSKQLNRVQDMTFARWYPTLITLPNGESMIHGGVDGGHAPVGPAEVFDGNNWRVLWGTNNGDIINDGEGKWFYPRDWVAPNGRVFGMTGNVMYWLDWGGDGGTQVAGYLPNKTRSHTSAAVMYQPGKILQVGGSTNGDTLAEGSRQAITVDVTSGAPVVQDVQDMGWRRVWAGATVMANGEVLVSGGSAFENKQIDEARTAEIWNPNTRQFRAVATAQTGRLYHNVSILLPDGSVMTGGGGAPGPYNNLNAEIFYPPYLYNGGNWAARPEIRDFNVEQGYNNQQNIGFGGDVARVTLVRNGAVTHSFDMGQRFLDLKFANNGNGTVNVSMPNTANIAPPGYYMMFFLNAAGTPSYAKIVHLDPAHGSNNQGEGAANPQQPANPQHAANSAPQIGEVFSLVARHSNKCIDVAASGLDNGAAVQQYDCNNTNAQKFRVVDGGNGLFSLQNLNSNKCIDLEAWSMDPGHKLQQWECSGGNNQKFHAIQGNDGSFGLKIEHTGQCIDVAAWGQNNGAGIGQWHCGDHQANQEFWFRK